VRRERLAQRRDDGRALAGRHVAAAHVLLIDLELDAYVRRGVVAPAQVRREAVAFAEIRIVAAYDPVRPQRPERKLPAHAELAFPHAGRIVE